MNIIDFISEARNRLKPILSEKGCILYSAVNTLTRGNVYTIGLNPGGDPSNSIITIGNSLDDLPNYHENAYLDEAWSNHRRYQKGQHPLQKNMQILFGDKLREICSSNLIFLQSSDKHGARFHELADICWSVHRLIIDIVQPSVLIVFGIDSISPYSYLIKKMADKEPDSFPSGHGKLSCYAFNAKDENRRFKVIALPHLSYYSLKGKHSVIEWIKKEARL